MGNTRGTLHGSKRFAGMDELMASVAEQARIDVVGAGMPRDWPCMSSHDDEDPGVPIVDPAVPTCTDVDCIERRPHHHVSACGQVLLDELNRRTRPVAPPTKWKAIDDDPRRQIRQGQTQHQEDATGVLLEIVSR